MQCAPARAAAPDGVKQWWHAQGVDIGQQMLADVGLPRPRQGFQHLFFTEHLMQQRAMSPRTVATCRDAIVLFLDFAVVHLHKQPMTMRLRDVTQALILALLDYLERDRGNAVRTRNVRLAAPRAFLKFASHRDVDALHVVEQALGVPMKRFGRPMSCSTVKAIRVWLTLNPELVPASAPLPNRDDHPMTCANVTQRLALAVAAATPTMPSLRGLRISPHIVRHSTAMHMLQSGEHIEGIARWLGLESPTTTHHV